MRVSAGDEHNNFTLLRLILAFAVVLGHFQLLSGVADPPFPFNLADAAVDSFFVVSGFLIALSYTRSPGVWPFYIRRLFRLYPMYACIVIIQTGALLLQLPHGPFSEPYQTINYLVANLVFANFLVTDIGQVLSTLPVSNINPSLWTLKIEIGFYLVVPLIFAGMRRYGHAFMILLFVASAGYDIVAQWLGDPRMAKQLPGQIQFFVVGMLLFWYARDCRIPYWASGIVALVFLASWTYLHPIQPAICPLLVGVFVFSMALCTPVVRVSTDVSYSVYLVHGPIIQILLLLGWMRLSLIWLFGIVLGVLAISFACEYLVERPGNELGRSLSRVLVSRQRSAAVTVRTKVAA